MKLGFSTLGSPYWTIDQVIKAAVASGFDGVELRMIRGEVDLAALDEFRSPELERSRRRFAEAGVEVICVDTSVRLGEVAGPGRKPQLELAHASFAVAEGLAAPFVRVFGGDLAPEIGATLSPPAAVSIFREAFAEVAAIARRYHTTALLETHDSFSTGRDVAALFTADGDDLPAGVLWDVLHSYRHGEPLTDTYAAIGPWLELVHVKDSATFSADGFDLKLIGEGVVPIPEAVRLLAERGYRGYLSFEWEKGWHPELDEPEIALPHYAAAMRALLDAL